MMGATVVRGERGDFWSGDRWKVCERCGVEWRATFRSTATECSSCDSFRAGEERAKVECIAPNVSGRTGYEKHGCRCERCYSAKAERYDRQNRHRQARRAVASRGELVSA